VYRPLGPRFRLLHLTTRLRAWLLTPGASRLVCLPIRSKHMAPHHFQPSLEEAAVRRPGHEAGIKSRISSSAEGAAQQSCGPGQTLGFFHGFADPPRRVARRGKDTTRLGASSSHGDVEEAHRTAIWDTRVVIGLSCGHDAH